jgi:hypothetical protein
MPLRARLALAAAGRAPVAALLATIGLIVTTDADAAPRPAPTHARFEREVRPLLREHCYDCHADGRDKGKVAFDTYGSIDALVADRALWAKVLANLRGGLMPPAGRPRPRANAARKVEAWIKRDALALDPRAPDPGRVTIRRLNRVEYRNTVRDLTGVEVDTELELPPDDTGYGFDNIGDVLSVSPLLLEKYMQIAETVVAAVPRVPRQPAERAIASTAFVPTAGEAQPRYSFKEPAQLAATTRLDASGRFRVSLAVDVQGPFDFDPTRATLTFSIDGVEKLRQELGWHSDKKLRFDHEEDLTQGDHRFEIALTPGTPPAADGKTYFGKPRTPITLRIGAVDLLGPLDPARWVPTRNYARFFPRPLAADASEGERRGYAAEVLGRFARRAFRRPVEPAFVARLVNVAAAAWAQAGRRFEDGVAEAMLPVLSSPRFLFRLEGEAVADQGKFPLIDEHALAARLSYFLWSSMPDDELAALADAGRLRRVLRRQIERMLADPKAQALLANFTGQWLQVRDIPGFHVSVPEVMARDRGEEREMIAFLEEIERYQNAKSDPNKPREKILAEQESISRGFKRFFSNELDLNAEVRTAMQKETELVFGHVARGDRSVLELLDADYTFLNEKLARHYGIPDVKGGDMRLVKLPKGSMRGGVLTQGAVLVVTSNPTRTSPVKRGLFILDNVLGMPPPPAPADVPPLELSDKKTGDREPTLREVLAIHREQPLCASCHNRMDPLGLALEGFNAMGLERKRERGQPIDTAGKLITGERFADVREVKKLLATRYRDSFYRCLTEKLLTYALGRGLTHADVGTVDAIVTRLQQARGRWKALLAGVIDSAPFQRRAPRPAVTTTAHAP